jgi:hypothetical protein
VLLAGAAAYGITYLVFPGYVYNGYINRHAPFLAFISDILLALVFYAFAAVAGRVLNRAPSRRTSPNRTASHPWQLIGSLSAAGFLVMCGSWLALQREYLRIVHPDNYYFIKRLAHAPYRGASFVVNTYAAPIAAQTHTWAYMDPAFFAGTLQLTPEGFAVPTESTYLWLADRGTNPAYAKPDYALVIAPTDWDAALESYSDHVRGLPGPPGPFSVGGFAHRASAAFSAFLHEQVVASDVLAGRDRFAVIRLDWDYPPFLQPLSAQESPPNNLRVRDRRRWVLEVMTESGSHGESAQPAAEIEGISIAGRKVDLTTYSLTDENWDPAGTLGRSPQGSLRSQPGREAWMEAVVIGDAFRLDLRSGPKFGRVRVTAGDLNGEVDLQATAEGIKSLEFSSDQAEGELTSRPAVQAGEYLNLEKDGAGIALTYRYAHQEGRPEENTRIDLIAQDESGVWHPAQAVILLGRAGWPVDIFDFRRKNPDTLAEYANRRAAGDQRTYVQWLSDYLMANPDERRRPGLLAKAGVFAAPEGSEPAVRHIRLPLSPGVSGTVFASLRPGTRTKLGPYYPSNTIIVADQGRVGATAGHGPASTPGVLASNYGALDLQVRLPPGQIGRSEPLVTTGVTGAANMIYITYVDHDHARIGFDYWGVGGFMGPVFALDYSKAHRLEISMGSLYPAASASSLRDLSRSAVDLLKRHVLAKVDGAIVLAGESECYESPPALVEVGRNGVGASTAGPAFTGQILKVRRVFAPGGPAP